MKQIYCIEGTSCSQYPLSPRKIIKKSIGSILGVIVIGFFVGITAAGVIQELRIGQELSNSDLSLLLNTGLFWPGILLLYLMGNVIYQVFYFRYYFYNITADSLIIKKGVISRGEIVINYEKIQNVFVDQDFWDRLLSIYDVHVATADSQSILMAHIDGVSRENSEQLRTLLLDNMKTRKLNSNQGI